MKQILSVADLATMLDLVNRAIERMKTDFLYVSPETIVKGRIITLSSKKIKEEQDRLFEQMKENSYYQSLMRLKTALENLNVEIETPELEIEPNFYDAKTFDKNKEDKGL